MAQEKGIIKYETIRGTIILRQARITDAASIITYMNWVTGEVEYHTFGENDFFVSVADEEKIIESFQQRGNCMMLLALCNDEIIAIASLAGGIKQRVSHRGTIGITITKKFWRLGLGLKMMTILVAYAKKSKYLSKLELLVHEENMPARALYTQLGFSEEGKIARYFMINGKYYDGINMGLIVD